MPTCLVILLAAASAARAAALGGLWDASITSNGVVVPFRMEISEAPARVCFFEGAQPVCSTSARVQGANLTARWDYLNTELQLSVNNGELSGDYQNLRTRQPSPVEAKPHRASLPAAEPPAKFDGVWEIHSKERPTISWHLLLRQSGENLEGTILRVDGDVGTLAGKAFGRHFLISHFSGDRPTVVEGTLLDNGTIDLTQGKTKLYAIRPADARARGLDPPPDPATYARARNPAEKFVFRFPDLNGRMMTDADFAGHPLIVTITGSWCPNCRDEAPFLSELYSRYHDAGLRIVGFCFEYDEDVDHGQLKAFIRKYAIAYPMLLAGEPAKLSAAVPQIENLSAFPTSIYIGRDGRVRAVHTGFPSAGSGDELVQVKDEVRSIVERMLAEKPGPSRK